MVVPKLMRETVVSLQKTIGYRFKDSRLLWQAVQAPGTLVRSEEIDDPGSVHHSQGYSRLPDGNKRLALVGDAALKMVLVEDWYQGGTSRERGNRILSDVATNFNLTRVGQCHKLDEHINPNPSSDKVSPMTIADTVEALCGAVYVDGGLPSVSQIMRNLGLLPRLIRKIERDKPGDPAPFSEVKAAEAATKRAAKESASKAEMKAAKKVAKRAAKETRAHTSFTTIASS